MRRVSRSNLVILSLLVTSGAVSIQACAKKKQASPAGPAGLERSGAGGVDVS
jgi:hypothetical protein